MSYNLLPEQHRPRKPNKKVRGFIILNIFLLLFVSLYYGSIANEVQEKEETFLQKERQHTETTKEVKDLKEEVRSDDVYNLLMQSADNGNIAPLKKESFPYGEFIILLSKTTPSDMVIMGIDSHNDEEVFIHGQAKNYFSLVEFYKKLEHLNVFYELKFQKIEDYLDEGIIVFSLIGNASDRRAVDE